MNKNQTIGLALSALKRELLLRCSLGGHFCFNSPEIVYICITSRCNARCLTCDIWKNRDYSDELTDQEWKCFLSDLAGRIKPVYIKFFAGEPFTRTGFCDILHHANKLGIYTTALSNGLVFTEAFCDEVVTTGLNAIEFSLNSIEPELHDRYKGVNGLHERVVHAIRHLKKKKSPLKVFATLIVTNENYRILDHFVRWVYALGADMIGFSFIHENYRFRSGPKPASDVNPYLKIDDLPEFDRQIDLLIDMKKKGYPIGVPIDSLKAAKIYYRNPFHVPRKSYCDIGYRRLFITACGDAYLCQCKESIGNLKDDHVGNIWFSRKAQLQRKLLLGCKDVCVAATLREVGLNDKLSHFFNCMSSTTFAHPPQV